MSLIVQQIAGDALWIGPRGPHRRRFGVPEGGAFDRTSCEWACHLAASRFAVEMGPFGGRFLADRALSVSVVGADRSLTCNGRPTRQGRINLQSGDVLEVGPVSQGCRSYLSVTGGRGEGPVRRGDVIFGECGEQDALLGERPPSLRPGPFGILEGPESSEFDMTDFLRATWVVQPQSDRRGVRLAGPLMAATGDLGERLSEPQPVGTVQVTLAGAPLVIGPDGPTIGGYPRLAVVIDADRDRLGQLVPGDSVRFERVSRDEALARWHAHRECTLSP